MRVYSQQQKDEQQKQKQNCHNNKEQENQRNNLAKTLISNSKKMRNTRRHAINVLPHHIVLNDKLKSRIVGTLSPPSKNNYLSIPFLCNHTVIA